MKQVLHAVNVSVHIDIGVRDFMVLDHIRLSQWFDSGIGLDGARKFWGTVLLEFLSMELDEVNRFSCFVVDS